MATIDDEIALHEQAALMGAKISDRKERIALGLRIDYNLRALDDEYRILDQVSIYHDRAVKLRAVIQIVHEFLLYDALEDEDWQEAMPDHYGGDIHAYLRGEGVR